MSRKKRVVTEMFAMIIERDGVKWRSGFKFDRQEAIEYAERMAGVIEIEEIGKGIIWHRPVDS